MQQSDKTARQLYEEAIASGAGRAFGFGKRPALINVDFQNAYTRPGDYGSAYEGHPRQIEYVNELASLVRSQGGPVVWTYIAYSATGEDCGVWNIRANSPDAIQNMKVGSARSELDARLQINRERDVLLNKRMASAFFETHLGSLFTFHKIDTVIVTGGSTSGCVRATVVDSLSRGFRT
ncbi:MAG: isochorismatase family protein, partial [Burkholderiaceae bacterium]|nr:isochorismatase family protein [Burkholderiaceae bacterium]